MLTMWSDKQARPRSHSQFVRTLATCGSLLAPTAAAAAATALTATSAWAQRVRVTGTVANPAGTPLEGVQVRVAGDSGAVVTTNQSGRYTIQAPATGSLRFAFVGYQPQTVALNGRTALDVVMQVRVAVLSEVVVSTSGYGGDAQRRSEITGAIASVNVAATGRQTSASVLQKLDATVSGVTVADNGSPGSRSTVRIRGISSFQNNDPLYIVDGTPLQDSYVNFINPDDIESMQVLKDASAASIYGSRASNGVIIIQTRKGGQTGAPRTRLSARTGIQSPYRGYDDFVLTNSLDYFKVAYQSYVNAGYTQAQIISKLGNIYGDPNNPTIPQYLYADPKTATGADAYGRPVGVDPSKYAYPNALIMPGSAGTNWFKSVFGTAPVSDVNLGVSGAGTGTQYAVSFNYFDQNGTAAYNRFRRGSVRANTQFTRKAFTVGENLAIIGESNVGGLSDDRYSEGGILGANILALPVVSVYDINGNFGGAKANNTGRVTNPLKLAYAGRNNTNTTTRFFGNVFANYDVTPRIALRTQLGGNVGTQSYQQYSAATPENVEPTNQDGFLENDRRFTDYTWSNTARYSNRSGPHNVAVLAGQEYNHYNQRFLQGGINNLISNGINSQFIQSALGTPTLPFSYGGQNALLSFFGKADYTYNDRYTATLTVRRDGSSNLGPEHRWGTFPAGGLAWHASRERFLENNGVISDLQVRVGYGITGNQLIPSARVVDQFSGTTGGTYYGINGGTSSTVPGYRLSSIGNPNLKWEQQKQLNGGFDMGLFNNNLTVVADVYNRLTNDLLFAPPVPATAGLADAPIVNIGAMRNTGVDFTVGHSGRSWSLQFNGSHYNNKITRIDGNRDSFFGPTNSVRGGVPPVINQIGQPIGSFYGYQADGYFRDSADVAAHAKQDGAAPGRIKFRDVNGDGAVTAADRTIIGSPHPKFTGGLDGTVRRGRFDLGATLFGTFGNKIFDAQKDYYVFQDLTSNVRSDLLQNSWRPDNLNAKYPRLDANDVYSRAYSSYYVESGTYVRLRSLQLGYTLPGNLARFIPGGSRIYVQAENLFTITGYNGLDPALPPANVTAANNTLDIRDQFRGVDQGVYPTSRTFSFGFTTSF